MSEYAEGFYWVICGGRWQVAEFDGINWFICGFEEPRSDLRIVRRIETPSDHTTDVGTKGLRDLGVIRDFYGSHGFDD